MTFRRGDRVLISLNDVCYGGDRRSVEGFVYYASTNGKSLMLGFEAVLDGHVGLMPVSQADDGGYVTVMTGGNIVTITPRQKQQGENSGVPSS